MRALNSGNIDHVECHGTGTSLGDPIEIRAVSRCYGAATISSIKSLLGHAEAASGIVSLLACLQQMKHNYRAPQSCFTCPNPKAEFGELVVSAIGEETSADRMAINNFGFSGTNCSIIVEKLPPRLFPDQIFAKYHMAPISSTDRGSLRRMVDEFKSYVEESDQLIGHICTKLQKGRPFHRYRHCILYNCKRQIVWETGAPLDDTESLGPLHVPDFTIFAYGHGFHHYQQNNRGNGPHGFFKQLIPKLDPKNTPEFPITPLRFHQFIASSYVDGHSINWNVYNSDTLNKDTLLPPYHFNNKKYWPFEKQFACNFPASKSSRKQIYYERTRLKVPQSHQRDRSLPVVNLGMHVGLANCEHHTVSEFQLLSSSHQKRIVLFHPCSSSITEALELISLWQILETQSNFVLVIACRNNGTSYTEWTTLCRTLASERLLPYKFVSYTSFEELESELSFEDIYECIFYEQSCRYVERLAPVTLKKSQFVSPKHLLITGGTGGVGKRIIEFMNPERTTVVTRNPKNGPARRDGGSQTFIESKLATLSLPANEEYDVVVHCAGVVDNALMASMDYSRITHNGDPLGTVEEYWDASGG
ncbi:Beta-ketoacyl synthase protein [Teladorsagia circumcincta]|uniref:Beta-ketoacyl synthase protein n=1 Tax=Teladorsagia circumcincta TaxID=45464 RepID=A0A2G9TD31_TELCI|nr:Beta-ketoacyl synthase protein [Teladorsagia circumcincta]